MTGPDPTAEHVEPTPRRIRVRLGSRLVADSTRALLMVRYGPKGLPTYFVPRADVVADALVDGSRAVLTASRRGRCAPDPTRRSARPGRTRTRSWPGT